MVLQLALDQNFPEPILDCLGTYIKDVQLVPLRKIRDDLPEMSDRHLLLVLDGLGWPGLVTNNYRMMRNPEELASLLKTKLTMFVVEGAGHDPIRATGAVLLDLPGAIKKMQADRAEVFWMRPRNPEAQKPWDLFSTAASRMHREASELYKELKVSDEEMAEAMRFPR